MFFQTDYIFFLLGYTWCVVSFLALDHTDTLRFSLAVSRWWREERASTRTHAHTFTLVSLRCLSLYFGICTSPTCMQIMECVHVSARVCVDVHSYFGVCDIWRFAPKANKSVMPGIRPWPLLKLRRRAEGLINQTASHRCDGLHTNRQQTVKVTSSRVDCQPGRHAGRTPPLTFFPLCRIHPSVSAYPLLTSSVTLCAMHVKDLSWPSKNDLEGQGRSIFSDRGHGQTILGTHHISHYNAVLTSSSTAPLG